VVQLNQLKLQEITVFGLNCQRLVINATELFASEWTAVTIGELQLTASNLNKSNFALCLINMPIQLCRQFCILK
jgi:hypothetical protein